MTCGAANGNANGNGDARRASTYDSLETICNEVSSSSNTLNMSTNRRGFKNTGKHTPVERPVLELLGSTSSNCGRNPFHCGGRKNSSWPNSSTPTHELAFFCHPCREKGVLDVTSVLDSSRSLQSVLQAPLPTFCSFYVADLVPLLMVGFDLLCVAH